MTYYLLGLAIGALFLFVGFVITPFVARAAEKYWDWVNSLLHKRDR